MTIQASRPLISFTFDDFPRSALLIGGAILSRHGLAGTYYASLGLMDEDGPTGLIFGASDLPMLLEQGHELGCHTFAHCDSWATSARTFERSVVENRRTLHEYLPGAEFRTLSYPISPPRPLTKSRMASRFLGCRGGGQTFNVGTTDLNCLSAFFLEKARNNVVTVKDLIDRNRQAKGWLILATHDVCDSPTRFGCTPGFFEEVVAYACRSGARILPVASALNELQAPTVSSPPS